jgi:hypothetical protein
MKRLPFVPRDVPIALDDEHATARVDIDDPPIRRDGDRCARMRERGSRREKERGDER